MVDITKPLDRVMFSKNTISHSIFSESPRPHILRISKTHDKTSRQDTPTFPAHIEHPRENRQRKRHLSVSPLLQTLILTLFLPLYL